MGARPPAQKSALWPVRTASPWASPPHSHQPVCQCSGISFSAAKKARRSSGSRRDQGRKVELEVRIASVSRGGTGSRPPAAISATLRVRSG